MHTESKTPITVLCGFLGSGKTTLLRRWREDPTLRDAAFIVHDFSEFGVDADLIAEEGSIPRPGECVDRVAALHGSFTREHLHDSTGRALHDIARLDPKASHVLCESTGAARPWPLIQAVTQHEQFYLRHFIVTVDALNLHRDFWRWSGLCGEGRPVARSSAATRGRVIGRADSICQCHHPHQGGFGAKAVVETQIRILKTFSRAPALGYLHFLGFSWQNLMPPPHRHCWKRMHVPRNLGSQTIRPQPVALSLSSSEIHVLSTRSGSTMCVNSTWGPGYIAPRDFCGWPRVPLTYFFGNNRESNFFGTHQRVGGRSREKSIRKTECG